MTENFNDYFTNIGPKIAEGIDQGKYYFDDLLKKAPNRFKFPTVDTSEVFYLPYSLSVSKLVGLIKFLLRY